MTRFVERLALVGSFSVLSVAVLTGAKTTGRSLTDARIEELTTRLDAVERRLASAEHGAWMPGATGLTVKAPFVVTDANGLPIMTVQSTPRVMQISNPDKGVIVEVGTRGYGGYLEVNDVKEGRAVLLAAGDGIAALNLRDGPKASNRIELTIPKTGPAEIMVKNESHSPVVWISHAPAGAGGGGLKVMDDSSNALVAVSALPGGGLVKTSNKDRSRVALLGINGQNAVVELRDNASKPRATLAVTGDGKSALVLMNEAHINVLTLTQGAWSGGVFQLSDAKGLSMVEGGVNENGVGIVRVGPTYNCGGRVMGLLAGSCIFGKK